MLFPRHTVRSKQERALSGTNPLQNSLSLKCSRVKANRVERLSAVVVFGKTEGREGRRRQIAERCDCIGTMAAGPDAD